MSGYREWSTGEPLTLASNDRPTRCSFQCNKGNIMNREPAGERALDAVLSSGSSRYANISLWNLFG